MKRDFKKLVAAEAMAYFRSGMLAAGGRASIIEKRSRRPKLGIFFVPGYGASLSQLQPLKVALDAEAEYFDGFDYKVDRPAPQLASDLARAIEKTALACPRLLLIGHSLGGALSRLVLQSNDPPPNIAGFVSICAPLHGSWMCRMAPAAALRSLAPDGALVREMTNDAARLERLRGSILTVGARFDSFVQPYDSAFIDGEERLCLDDVGHVGALFDQRVHRAIIALARKLISSASGEREDVSGLR